MSQSRINLEVFCKRNGTRGIIVAEDDNILTIQTDGINKTVTESTFKRWYTIVPQEQEQSSEVVQPVQSEESISSNQNEDNVAEPKGKSERLNPSGEVGIGLELRKKFIEIVKNGANQSLDFTYDEKNCRDVIKYNGKNVFECTTARRRFNVLCHQKALTPDNIKRASKIHPKDWGWVLNVKFVFTEMSQVPLMRSIVTDSLYYRQKENRDD